MKSIKEFADELGVNERTVRRHISKLNIIPQKQGSKQLLNADAQELIKKAVVDSGQRTQCKKIDGNQRTVDRFYNEKSAVMNKVADSGQQSGDKTVDTGQRTLDNENNEEQAKKLLRTADSGQCESFEMYKIKAEMLQSQLELIQKQNEYFQFEIDILRKENQSQIAELKADKQFLQGQIDAQQKQIEQLTLERQTILAKYLVMNEEQEEQQEEVKATVVEPEPVKAEQEPTEQEEQQPQKQGFFARLFRKKTR